MKKEFQIAVEELGTKEVVGKLHNEEVLKYFTQIGHSWVTTDETAWCSAFVNWCLMMAGKDYSKKLNARSWLNMGEEVFTPEQGDVCVFWRHKKRSWKGHVGFYAYENETHVFVLSGNQNNMVCIKPYAKSRLLGFRRIN